jgi:regulator of protease activity HflC (stomatin/prohibitin superfamily)
VASIVRFVAFRHLRAEPNQFILHYRNGKLVRRGAGISYWFNPLSAAVAQVPVEDCETTFVLKERSVDFQELTVQCTLTYRFADPERAAARVNFTVSLQNGAWTEQPLERLANLWSQKAQQPARGYITNATLVEALRSGADQIRSGVEAALRSDPEIAAMGLNLVSVLVSRIAPTAELEKALQTPTREALQQKADEAVFSRRALAVEKERAIKENELATQIELARRQEQLIRQQGSNQLLEIRQQAETEKARVEAEAERQQIAADAAALSTAKRARGEAEARRFVAQADAEAEERRVALWRETPAKVALGLALQGFAGKVQNIQHLNLSPDLLGSALQQFLRDEAGR